MSTHFAQFKNIHLRHATIVMSAVFALMGVFGVAHYGLSASMGWLGNAIETSILSIVTAIIYGFIWVFGLLVTKSLIPILVMVASYNDFATEYGVQLGWTVVRDVSNMFFIIVLLVIAVATIFKVESYSYRALLPKLLIMAVLINFSRMITGFFIDFAQIIMLTFVNSFRDVAGGNIVDATGIGRIFSYLPEALKKGQDVESLKVFGALLLGLAITAVTAGVLLAFIVVLVFRVIMLWTLTVLSPLAYLLSAFPGGQKYSGQWWEKFTSHLIVGPVLAFFLWLSFAIMQQGLFTRRQNSTFGQFLAGEKVTIEDYNPYGTEAGATDNLINFIIVIALLLGSLTLTQQLGAMGGQFAGTVSGTLSKIGIGAVKAAAYPAKSFIGAQVDDLAARTGIDLNIPRFIKDFKEAKQARREEKHLMAIQQSGDKLKKVSGPFRRLKTVLYASGSGGYTGDELTTWKGITRFFKGNLGVKAEKEAQEKLDKRMERTRYQMRLRGMKEGLGDETKKTRKQGIADQKARITEMDQAKDAQLKERNKYIRNIGTAEDAMNKKIRDAKGDKEEEQAAENILRRQLNEVIEDNNFKDELKDKDDNKVEVTADVRTLKEAVERALNAGFQKAEDEFKVQDTLVKQLASSFEKIEDISNKAAKGEKLTSKDLEDAQDEETKYIEAEYQLNFGQQVDILRKRTKLLDDLKKAKGEDRPKLFADAQKEGYIEAEEDEQAIVKNNKEYKKELDEAEKRKNEAIAALTTVAKAEDFTWEGIEKRKVEVRQKEISNELEKINKGGHLMGLTNAEQKQRDERTTELERLLREIRDKIGETKDEDQLRILKKNEKVMDDELKTLDGLKDKASMVQLGSADRKREVEEYVEKLKGEQEKNIGKLAVPKASDGQKAAFNEEIENIETEAHRLQSEAAHLRMPTNFEASTARRALESHELQKMGDVKNYQELNAYLEDAIHDKRWGRVGAIMRSLARDYNDNEAFNYFNYASDFSGMRKFTKEQLIDTAKMPKQAAYALMNDVAHINEQVNHWETGRVMDVRNGEFVWKTEAGHAMESLAELRKQGPRYALQKLNRLGYGGERQYADGHRDFFIKPLGLAITQTFAPDMAQMMVERGNELNKNAMEKLFLTKDVQKIMRQMSKIWGSSYIDRLGKKVGFAAAANQYTQGLGRLEDYNLQAVVENGMHHFLTQGIWQQYMADALKESQKGSNH